MKPRLLISAATLLLMAAMPAQAQLFGPSDAQIAHEREQDEQLRANADAIRQTDQQARAGQQQLQDQIRELQDRVRNLTDSLARATGTNEELGFQLRQMDTRLTQQERDFSYRLCVISAQQLGADAQGLNCAAAGTQNPAPQAPSSQFSAAPGSPLPPIVPNSVVPGSSSNAGPGRGPGVLGTLSSSGPAVGGRAGAIANAPSSGGDSRQYDAALNLLGRGQYNEATAAFRGYADTYPDDQTLAPQALYWVGTISYMQQDYPAAARVLAEAIKKYPKSPQSPESMLKLGQTLVAQGQTSNGCTAFAAIAKQYPNASQSTKTAATNARRAAKC
jgi:tol-pal system protein YbgF